VTYGFAAFSKRVLTSCVLTSCANQPFLQGLAERDSTSLLSLCAALPSCVNADTKPSQKLQTWAGYKYAETQNMPPSSPRGWEPTPVGRASVTVYNLCVLCAAPLLTGGDPLICLQTYTRRSMVDILRQQLSCNIPGRVHFRLYIIRHKFTTFNSNFHPSCRSPSLTFQHSITFFDMRTASSIDILDVPGRSKAAQKWRAVL
jgi:hypothetical protein